MRRSTLLGRSLRRLPLVAAASVATLALAACAGSDGDGAEDPAGSTGVETSRPASPEESSSAPMTPPPATATYDEPDQITDITLASPANGARVSGTIDVSGTADSFEANVAWYLADSQLAIVLQGAFTAQGWGDSLYPYSGSIDISGLAPGDYTLVVSTDDPSDGEGKGAQQLEAGVTVE